MMSPNEGEVGDPSSSCSECEANRQKLKRLDEEHIKRFLGLKKKIISTDLLITKYKAQCTELNMCRSKLDSVVSRIKARDKELQEVEQKLQQSKQENKQLTDTQSLLQSKCSALESEVIRKKDLIVSLEAVQRQSTICSQNYEKEIDEQKAQLNTMRIQLMNRNSKGDGKLAAVTERLEKSNETNASLKEELKNLKVELKKQKLDHNKEIKSLEKKLSSSQKTQSSPRNKARPQKTRESVSTETEAKNQTIGSKSGFNSDEENDNEVGMLTQQDNKKIKISSIPATKNEDPAPNKKRGTKKSTNQQSAANKRLTKNKSSSLSSSSSSSSSSEDSDTISSDDGDNDGTATKVDVQKELMRIMNRSKLLSPLRKTPPHVSSPRPDPYQVSNSEPGEKQTKPAQGRRKLKSFSQADKEISQPQATASTGVHHINTSGATSQHSADLTTTPQIIVTDTSEKSKTDNNVKSDGKTSITTSNPHHTPHTFSELIGDLSSSSESETEDPKTVPFTSKSSIKEADIKLEAKNDSKNFEKNKEVDPETFEEHGAEIQSCAGPERSHVTVEQSLIENDQLVADQRTGVESDKRDKPIEVDKNKSNTTGKNMERNSVEIKTSASSGNAKVTTGGKRSLLQSTQSTSSSDKKDLATRLKSIRPVKRVIRKAAAVAPELDITSRKYPMRDSKANTPVVSDEEGVDDKNKSSEQQPNIATLSKDVSAATSLGKKRIARVQSLPQPLAPVSRQESSHASTTSVAHESATKEETSSTLTLSAAQESDKTNKADEDSIQSKLEHSDRLSSNDLDNQTAASTQAETTKQKITMKSTEQVEETSTKSATAPTEPPVKRKRGRPKKSDKIAESSHVETPTKQNDESAIIKGNVNEESKQKKAVKRRKKGDEPAAVDAVVGVRQEESSESKASTNNTKATDPTAQSDKAKKREEHRNSWLTKALSMRADEEMVLSNMEKASNKTDSAWDIALQASKWAAAKKRGEIPTDAVQPDFQAAESKPRSDPRKVEQNKQVVTAVVVGDAGKESLGGQCRKSPRLKKASHKTMKSPTKNSKEQEDCGHAITKTFREETKVTKLVAATKQDMRDVRNQEGTPIVADELLTKGITCKKKNIDDRDVDQQNETSEIVAVTPVTKSPQMKQSPINDKLEVKGQKNSDTESASESKEESAKMKLRTRKVIRSNRDDQTSDSESEIAALPAPAMRRSLRTRSTSKVEVETCDALSDKSNDLCSDSGTPTQPRLKLDVSTDSHTGAESLIKPKSAAGLRKPNMVGNTHSHSKAEEPASSGASEKKVIGKDEDSDSEGIPETPTTRTLRRKKAQPVTDETDKCIVDSTETDIKLVVPAAIQPPRGTKSFSRKEALSLPPPSLNLRKRKNSGTPMGKVYNEDEQPPRRRTRSSSHMRSDSEESGNVTKPLVGAEPGSDPQSEQKMERSLKSDTLPKADTKSPASPSADQSAANEIISPASPVEIASPPQSPMSTSDSQSPTRLFIFEEPTVIPTSPDKSGVVYVNIAPPVIPTTPPRSPTIRQIPLNDEELVKNRSLDEQTNQVQAQCRHAEPANQIEMESAERSNALNVVNTKDKSMKVFDKTKETINEVTCEGQSTNEGKADMVSTQEERSTDKAKVDIVSTHEGQSTIQAKAKMTTHEGQLSNKGKDVIVSSCEGQLTNEAKAKVTTHQGQLTNKATVDIVSSSEGQSTNELKADIVSSFEGQSASKGTADKVTTDQETDEDTPLSKLVPAFNVSKAPASKSTSATASTRRSSRLKTLSESRSDPSMDTDQCGKLSKNTTSSKSSRKESLEISSQSEDTASQVTMKDDKASLSSMAPPPVVDGNEQPVDECTDISSDSDSGDDTPLTEQNVKSLHSFFKHLGVDSSPSLGFILRPVTPIKDPPGLAEMVARKKSQQSTASTSGAKTDKLQVPKRVRKQPAASTAMPLDLITMSAPPELPANLQPLKINVMQAKNAAAQSMFKSQRPKKKKKKKNAQKNKKQQQHDQFQTAIKKQTAEREKVIKFVSAGTAAAEKAGPPVDRTLLSYADGDMFG